MTPEKLAPRLKAELQSNDNEYWLSPISAWEVLLLAKKGRVELRDDPVAWITRAWAKAPFHEAPINREVVIQAELLDLPHRDPADRFLAATALVYELTLVTADDRLLRAKGISLLPNA